jgi:hypothetical protein
MLKLFGNIAIRNLKIVLSVALLIYIAIAATDAITNTKITRLSEMTEALLKIEKINYKEAGKIRKQKEAIRILEEKAAKFEAEALLNSKTLRTFLFYRDAGTLYVWKWITPELIKRTRLYCEKWKHLSGTNETTIDLVEFMQGVIHNESNYDEKAEFKEADGTISYGITMLNDNRKGSIEDIAKRLPPELKGRNIRKDAEANIAGRYIWIKIRKERGQAWAIMRNGWTLYAILRAVK